MTVAVTCILIVLARITDVSLDTVRTVAIVQGRKLFAAILGFFEALIYLCAVSKVLLNMNHSVYILAYGLGFALGTFFGIAVEQRLAFGRQLASLFTKKGLEMVNGLAAAGYRLAQVQAHIRKDDVSIVYVEVPRKQAQQLIRVAMGIDKSCFCIVNDVRVAGLIVKNTPKGSELPRFIQVENERQTCAGDATTHSKGNSLPPDSM